MWKRLEAKSEGAKGCKVKEEEEEDEEEEEEEGELRVSTRWIWKECGWS